MTLLQSTLQYPVLPRVAMIVLIYALAVGGVVAAELAWRGRPWYGLATGGAGLIMFGALLSRPFLSSRVSVTAIGAGVALGIFAVALDLIFGMPSTSDYGAAGELIDQRFE